MGEDADAFDCSRRIFLRSDAPGVELLGKVGLFGGQLYTNQLRRMNDPDNGLE